MAFDSHTHMITHHTVHLDVRHQSIRRHTRRLHRSCRRGRRRMIDAPEHSHHLRIVVRTLADVRQQPVDLHQTQVDLVHGRYELALYDRAEDERKRVHEPDQHGHRVENGRKHEAIDDHNHTERQPNDRHAFRIEPLVVLVVRLPRQRDAEQPAIDGVQFARQPAALAQLVGAQRQRVAAHADGETEEIMNEVADQTDGRIVVVRLDGDDEVEADRVEDVECGAGGELQAIVGGARHAAYLWDDGW